MSIVWMGTANALPGCEFAPEPLSSPPLHARIYLFALLAALATLLICAGRLAGGEGHKRVVATILFLCAGGCVVLGAHYWQPAHEHPSALAALWSQLLEPREHNGSAVAATLGANTFAALASESKSATDQTRTWLVGMLDQLPARWALMLVLLGFALASIVAVWPARRRGRDGIVPLHQAYQHIGVGLEAGRLGAIMEAGLPVPKGVVLTSDFLARWCLAADDEKFRLARRVSSAVGREPYAIRLSASGSTLAATRHDIERSQTNTDVSRESLSVAIDVVVAAFWDGGAHPPCTKGAALAVIVQRMVRPQFSGVLFTRAPDAPGLMLVEMVEGSADELVSGGATPLSFRFGRRSGRRIGGATSSVDLEPLVAFGRQLEQRFGAPQEIEWIWDGQKLWLVRCRDIAADASSSPTAILNEWDRALKLTDDGVSGTRETLVRNAMCEALPRPTPATQSLIEAIHASGGSVDRARRALGLSYNVEKEAAPIFPVLFGRLYHNVAEARRREPKLSGRDKRRIRGQAGALQKRMRGEVLPQLEARLADTAAADFDGLPIAHLVSTVRGIVERFVTQTQVESEIVNFVTKVVVRAAQDALRSGGHDPARWLAPGGQTMEEAALASAARLPRIEALDVLRTALGHRATLDYALAAPRFAEDAGALEARLASYQRSERTRSSLMVDGKQLVGNLARITELARTMQTLKADVKHMALRELAVLRRALLALDRRFDLGNRIFLMSLPEITALAPGDRDRVQKLVAVREAERAMVASACSLPSALSLAAVETASWQSHESAERRRNGLASKLVGTRVAGSRRAGGRACVVGDAAAEAGQALVQLMPGDVLVAPFIHPAWLGDIIRASGVITARGGWLSRIATIARERNIAMTVGVGDWADIPNGAHVTLDLDGSIRMDAPHYLPALADLRMLVGVEE
ncbi:MAG: PEP-utilizing enzyme [Hyphomicrobiaceae bacterium]